MSMNLDALIGKAAQLEGTSEWTLVDCVKNPEIAWEVIGLLIKEDAMITEIVGRQNKDTLRTNVSTIKEMANIRKKIAKYAAGDYEDTYKKFYKELTVTLDTYIANVLVDMYEEDDSIIATASAIKAQKKAETAARLAKAREAKAEK